MDSSMYYLPREIFLNSKDILIVYCLLETVAYSHVHTVRSRSGQSCFVWTWDLPGMVNHLVY